MTKTLTTYERRQAIIRILQEQSGIKVNDLARMLHVSEGTVRNDLAALDEENQITRVRGGAVPRTPTLVSSNSVAARARVNFDAKQRIAQWAASMVEDGDTIMLDASTTVLHMASFLSSRRNVTIVTNGIEVSRRLAENGQNTVILLGGILHPDGNAITGTLGSPMLETLHIRTAFVSCVGFSLQAGLLESDIAQAQIKHSMIQAAQRVVALVDQSKFDHIAVTAFARLADIDLLVTDEQVPPAALAALDAAGIPVAVCGDHTTTTHKPNGGSQKRYRIGFANLSEEMAFGRDVRRGLERAAADTGQIDLVLGDNQLSGEIALDVADTLIAQDIDLMIEYQIDETIGNQLMHKFSQANVPVIAVDIPMVGATFFGVDNYATGILAGRALGQAVQREWHGQYDYVVVLEHPRAGSLTAARIQGQLDGLEEVIGEIEPAALIRLDSGNTTQISEREMLEVLESLPGARRIPIICFNDDAAIGALNAARKVNRAQDVLIAGQGADRRLRDELRRDNPRVVGSTAFRPEAYGARLIELALKILRGEQVPPAVYVDPAFISQHNIDLEYPNESVGR
ncbi:MAG: substrate-binding domain-containing protein [Pleurocapsa minor GSE-CHR-MK-17-07R]|jgi:ribose transport system substrate-binding protein|nr:substrate-binding domain-containing protein [Pleurocapsa minor GSE-CHR-MK 17-07R]